MPEFYPNNYGGLPEELSGLKESRYVILPLPYEVTTSYGKGTKLGPRAIVEASRNMELYDEELRAEPCEAGIHTAGDLLFHDIDPKAMVKAVKEAVAHYLKLGKTVVCLGGEHNLTFPAYAAHLERHKELGILQIDAHADLRDTYEGTPFNHACVMRRCVGSAKGVAQVGIRSLSREEADYLETRKKKWPILWARECQGDESWMDAAIAAMPKKVYLTVDIDGLDPSLVPGTGTPEPGGLLWYPTLRFLRRLAKEREIVGFDLMELAPAPGHHAGDFLAARLVYKIIGYMEEARGALR